MTDPILASLPDDANIDPPSWHESVPHSDRDRSDQPPDLLAALQASIDRARAGRNRPVSTPSGHAAGLEGQGATQEPQDATEAAQGRVERYTEAIKDGLYLACPHCAGQGWTVQPNHWDDEAEQVQCERCAYLHSGLNPSPGAEREAVEIAARAVIAVADQEQAELRAEAAHWEHHAWEAGEGFKRAIEDAVRANARRRAVEARVAELEATVARVRALAEEWSDRPDVPGEAIWYGDHLRVILAAGDGQ